MNPFRKPLQVKVPIPGHYQSGEWVPGGYTLMDPSPSFSVQSIKDNQEVESLSEGRRITDYRRLYSDAKLQTTDDDALTEPCIVVIDGFDYEVKQRTPWQNGIIPHFKYYVVRINNG